MVRRIISLCTMISEAGFLLNFGTTTYAVNQFGLGTGTSLAAQSLFTGNTAGLSGLFSGSSLLSSNMSAWTASQLIAMIGVAGVPYLLYRLKASTSILFLALAVATGLGVWKLGAGTNNLVQIWNLLKKQV